MISRGLEISIAGGGGEMVRGEEMVRGAITWSFVFFLFYLLSSFICFRYQRPYAAQAMKRKKPISPITSACFTSSGEKSNNANG